MEKSASGQEEIIASNVYEIRGRRVMIDRCLAELFGVETRTLKQAVRRNLKRFPEDFMFEMSDAEFQEWRSRIVRSNKDRMGLRYAPFCFTGRGVKMLSCVLKSELAIEMNIIIIRVFVKLERALSAGK